jgi:hypothetical protein
MALKQVFRRTLRCGGVVPEKSPMRSEEAFARRSDRYDLPTSQGAKTMKEHYGGRRNFVSGALREAPHKQITGGGLIHAAEDHTICEKFLRLARDRGERGRPLPDLVVAAGMHFLDTPYEADTLEQGDEEELVINLRAFDCVTFVEAAVAMAQLMRSGTTAFAHYAAALERIRYRRGRCDGFPSRLHYFTDWLRANERRGIIRNITGEIGGIPFCKAFHSLTDRRAEHPGLAAPPAFRRMRLIEGILSRRQHHFIPRANFGQTESRIAAGDIIAITTDQAGIDVSHAGIACRLHGRLHLLHASSALAKVALSEAPLRCYLVAKGTRTGIIVGRLMP